MRMLVSILVPFLALLGACSENGFSRRRVSDEFLQAPSNQVDILWVIDNSVSMQNEQENVALGAADFMAQLETTAMDFHLGVISSDMSLGNTEKAVLLGNPPVLDNTVQYQSLFESRVRLGTGGDDQESGLEAAITAIEGPLSYTRNEGFLRAGAMLNIVMVSDENDCSDYGALGPDSTGEECYTQYDKLVPVADLVRRIKEIKGDDPVVMSGIVGPDIVDNCENTVPGRRYYTAIEMLGGVREDICQTEYSTVMNALGQVASGILTVFTLSSAAVEDTIEVTVTPDGGAPAAVARDEVNGWTYDAQYAQVTFHGTGVPPRGATIEISYEVAAGVTVAEDTATTP